MVNLVIMKVAESKQSPQAFSALLELDDLNWYVAGFGVAPGVHTTTARDVAQDFRLGRVEVETSTTGF